MSAFFDPGEFPWLSGLTPYLDDMRAEAEEVIGRYRYLRYRHADRYTRQNAMVVGDRATFYLQLYGMRLERNRAFCPRTCEALQAIPDLATSAIYLLDAGSRILPHSGVTGLLLRGHMGLIAPPGSFLRVGTEVRTWTEGGFLIFDDTLDHEAWNGSDRCRAILLFDFFRPTCDEEQRRRHLDELRWRIGEADYPYLAAAGLGCDDSAFMEAVTTRTPMPRLLPEIVAVSGMYLR